MEIKINYKGTSCQGTTYLYACSCGHEQQEQHPAAETPHICCDVCQGLMNKKPTAVNLDAELHENSKSHNIGWDYDESEE